LIDVSQKSLHSKGVIATNISPLDQSCEKGLLNADVSRRKTPTYAITITPLRERIDDIPLLIGYFAQKHSLRMNKRIETIPRETVDALCDYPWPGNVRELENFVERSVILSQSSDLQAPLGELKAPTSATSQSLNYSMTDSAPGPLSLEEMERKHIGEILERTKGVIGGKGGAAEVVGLPISTLRNRMKKLGMK